MKLAHEKTAIDGLKEIVEWERQCVMQAIRDSGGDMNDRLVARAMDRYGKACARLAPFEAPKLASIEVRRSPDEILDPSETPEQIVNQMAQIVRNSLLQIEGTCTEVPDGSVDDSSTAVPIKE